jgi:transposase
MAGFVIKLLEACPTTQAVCTLTRLSWSTVNAIMVSAVERGMLRRTEEEISYLGIDEKSSERGHTYASILTDIDRSRVLDLVPERKLEAAKTFAGNAHADPACCRSRRWPWICGLPT